jgi:uncharacterized protein
MGHARVQRLRSAFSHDFREVALWETGSSVHEQFALNETARLDTWLSDYFGFSVRLDNEVSRGFPDDGEAYGPTLTCESSLLVVAEWLGVSVESARRRFRTNLELRHGPAFFEDSLFGVPGQRRAFQLGDVCFWGHNPCQRCVVPTRDPDSAEPTLGFQRRFAESRKEKLPSWADVRHFNHYYRFALNTSVPTDQAGKVLRVGDRLRSQA